LGFRLKSQVAMEFVLLIMLAFMIMVVFIGFARDKMTDLRKEDEYVLLKDVTLAVQAEIITAKTVEDGYERTFTVPLTLDGINYTIGFTDGFLVSESLHHEYVVKISPVNGSINLGVNTIRKQEGEVYLNG
jgi:hypothetical protein